MKSMVLIIGVLCGYTMWAGRASFSGVSFLHYLNPTPNDRNLEWDMKHNLRQRPGDIGNLQP